MSIQLVGKWISLDEDEDPVVIEIDDVAGFPCFDTLDLLEETLRQIGAPVHPAAIADDENFFKVAREFGVKVFYNPKFMPDGKLHFAVLSENPLAKYGPVKGQA